MLTLVLKHRQSYKIIDTGKLELWNGRKEQIAEVEEIHVPEDTQLEYYFVWVNRSEDRKLIIHLDGPGASAKLTGLFYSTEDQVINLNSTMIHHGPNTYGNTYVKGVLKDSAKARLSGMIKIDKGAHGSDDLLTERVLLLSPKARAEALPMLEIDANDVKATHAATVSQLNKIQLYYLQTRGVPLAEAQQLIVEGFFEEILGLFPEDIKLSLQKTELPALLA